MTLTVVVPAFNAADSLGRALAAVQAQLRSEDALIVVDDGSTDGTAQVARDAGVAPIVLPQNCGVAAARNVAVEAAAPGVLLFTDADAELVPGVVERVRARMAAEPTVAGLVGVYARHCRPTDAVSRYKNLWIRHSYLASGPQVDFLFGCICAVRREAVLDHGGFDASVSRTAGGSDLELGRRMAAGGAVLMLDPRLEAVHGRAFTLRELLANDHRRAAGYVRLAFRREAASQGGVPTRYGNVGLGYVLGVAWMGLCCGLALAGLLGWGWTALLGALVLHALAYAGPHMRMARDGGPWVGLAGVGLLMLTQTAAGFGVVRGLLARPWRDRAR